MIANILLGMWTILAITGCYIVCVNDDTYES